MMELPSRIDFFLNGYITEKVDFNGKAIHNKKGIYRARGMPEQKYYSTCRYYLVINDGNHFFFEIHE
jgi:hypothetical protein